MKTINHILIRRHGLTGFKTTPAILHFLANNAEVRPSLLRHWFVNPWFARRSPLVHVAAFDYIFEQIMEKIS